MSYFKPIDAYQKMVEAIRSGKYKPRMHEYKRPGDEGGMDWANYRHHEAQLLNKFWEDVRNLYQVPEKAHSAVAKHAWSEGHSSGLLEVLNCYDELLSIVGACSE